jgi:hypothetical protein
MPETTSQRSPLGTADAVIGWASFFVVPLFIFFLWHQWPRDAVVPTSKVQGLVTQLANLKELSAANALTLEAARLKAEGKDANSEEKKVLDAQQSTAKDIQGRIDKTNADLAEAVRVSLAGSAATQVEGPQTKTSPAAQMLVLVALAGALGAAAYVAKSFAFHAGTGDYDAAWRWWYVLRVPVGAALAVILYFVVIGGLVGWQAIGANPFDRTNPLAVVGLGALAGAFANETFEKLKQVVVAALTSGTEAPAKTEVREASLSADRKTLLVKGLGFDGTVKAKANGTELKLKPDSVTKSAFEAVLESGAEIAAPGAAVELVVQVGKSTLKPFTFTVPN